MRPPSARISSMDGWRAFGLTCVVLTHWLHFTSVREIWPKWLMVVGDYGVIGLDGFFFISGFVITRGLLSEHRKFRSISLKAFYMRRAVRILPPLWLFLFVMTALGKLGLIDHRPLFSLYSGLFVCNLPVPGSCGWYAGHTWSLAYEEQFYLLFPVMLILCLKNKQLDMLWKMALALVVGTVFLTLTDRPAVAGAFRIASLMLIGVGCATNFSQISEWIANRKGWYFNLSLMALLSFPFWPQGIAIQVAYGLLAPILIAITLLGGAAHRSFFSRWLETRPMVYLGQISYTIYLWQQLATGFHGVCPPWFYPLSISVVLIWAMLSYHFFELPLIAYGADFSRRQHNGGIVNTLHAD